MEKRYKIFYVVNSFERVGGAENQVTILAEQMQQRGFDIVILSRRPVAKDNQYKLRIIAGGIRLIEPAKVATFLLEIFKDVILITGTVLSPIYAFKKEMILCEAVHKIREALFFDVILPLERPFLDLIFFINLGLATIFLKPRLIHAHTHGRSTKLTIDWIGILRKPLLYSEYSELALNTVTRRSRADVGGFEKSTLRKLRQYGTVIVLCRMIKRRALDIFLEGTKLEIMPDTVEIPSVLLQDERNDSGGGLLIGALGRFSHEKGFDLFIDGISLATENGIDAQFLLCGDGPERDSLRNLVKLKNLNNKVRFLGVLDYGRALQFIKSLDIFVLPSRSEGMPLTLLEAMALGKPVISFGVGSIPEVIANGESGLIIERENVQYLAEALIRLSKDKAMRERMGKTGREIYLEKYAPFVVCKKLEEIYKKMMKK